MEILVVGSARSLAEKEGLIQQAGREIGAELAKRGHTILVGSDDREDVDPYVVEGAIGEKPSTKIHVHVPKGLAPQYENVTGVKTIWHDFPDWDVTTSEVIRKVDAVLAIGGRLGVLHAGTSAWMMGKAVIPLGEFGGGAHTLSHYGSSRRVEFYHGALSDSEIARLASPWEKGVDATFVVDALERVAKAVTLTRVPKAALFSLLACVAVALIGWVAFLTFPFVLGPILFGGDWKEPSAWNFVLLFPTVWIAGLLGATMQTLRAIRRGDRLSLRNVLVDTGLGLAAGMVAAILYLVSQIAISGGVTIKVDPDDYARVAIIVSIASLFAALYLDTALARFDSVSDAVIAGKQEDA